MWFWFKYCDNTSDLLYINFMHRSHQAITRSKKTVHCCHHKQKLWWYKRSCGVPLPPSFYCLVLVLGIFSLLCFTVFTDKYVDNWVHSAREKSPIFVIMIPLFFFLAFLILFLRTLEGDLSFETPPAVKRLKAAVIKRAFCLFHFSTFWGSSCMHNICEGTIWCLWSS